MPRRYRIILLLVAGTVAVFLLLALLRPLTYSTSSNPSWLDRVENLYFNLKFAIAWYRQPGNGNSCIANLKQMDGAKATWALENKKTNSDIPTTNELYGVMNYAPVCPRGGIYTLGRVDERVRCSIPGHTL
jgi:hypothetical protein